MREKRKLAAGARTAAYRCCLVLALLVTAGIARAGEVKFTAAPKTVVDGKRVRITFALSTFTDVTVGIVNEKGVVVKHLAGGLLGPKPPTPLAADKLAQVLYWDRTDDMGKPVPAGKYSVQVQAGMQPKLDRVIGREHKALTNIPGMALGPKGELYVINYAGIWKESYKPAREIAVFSRECKYLRTILPFPGDLALEDVKGVRGIKRKDGTYVPNFYHGPGRRGYPNLSGRPHRQNMLVTPDGDLLFVSGLSTPGQMTPNWMVRIRATDGATPNPFEMIKFPVKGGHASGSPQLALSKDNRYVYAGGFITVDYSKRNKGALLNHAVYRWKLGSRDAPEVFAGRPLKAGYGKELFNQVHGVAVDGDGNVLVSDFGNDRVVVLSPVGKQIGEFKMEWPDHLCVDRKRGTIYIVCVDKSNENRGGGRIVWRKKTLVKVKSWKNPEILGKMPLHPLRGASYTMPCIALDDQADPPILWLTGYSHSVVSRIVEKDPLGPLGLVEKMVSVAMHQNMLASCEHLAVDPVTERLYVREFYKSGYDNKKGWHCFDGNTGKPLPLGPVNGAEVVVGLDNHLYTYKSSGWRGFKFTEGALRGGARILRWDLDGNPVPFPGSDVNHSESLPKGSDGGPPGEREGIRGIGAAPNGDIYVFYPTGHSQYSSATVLSVVGPDGKIKKAKLATLSQSASSPRVDREGHIYVLAGAIPKTSPKVPPDFETAAKKRYSLYPGAFGSVVKFPPTGGAVYRTGHKIGKTMLVPEKPRGQLTECHHGRVVDNAVWIRPHAAPVPSWEGACVCFPARMGLDRYGRLFVPVAPARQVKVMDTEGNEICVFGRYGNADNGGDKSLRPVKGIPLGWGHNVAVSDKAVYIADTNNRQVVKVRLDYAVSAKCQVPTP